MEDLNKEHLNKTLARLCKTIRISKPKHVVTKVLEKIEQGSEDSLDNLLLFEFSKFYSSQTKKLESKHTKRYRKLKEEIKQLQRNTSYK